jgi:hypothetical protein
MIAMPVRFKGLLLVHELGTNEEYFSRYKKDD